MSDDIRIDDYTDLTATSFESKEPLKPEEEYFHAVYIAGQSRKNHIGVIEQAGKIQVRGVEYNLDEVSMVITNVKEILARITVNKQNRESLDCFCYKSIQPWKGTSGRLCGVNSAERAANDYCNLCRSQIIVTGFYCDPSGRPVLQEGRPVFIFIRGKGVKYSNVSDHLSDLFKMENLEPIFEPVTEETRRFEKAVVNNKRFVTRITPGITSSAHGDKSVFVLEIGTKLSKQMVIDVLKVSKKTLDKFNDKFDWSKRTVSTTGYGEEGHNLPEDQQFPTDDIKDPVELESDSEDTFDFDKLKF